MHSGTTGTQTVSSPGTRCPSSPRCWSAGTCWSPRTVCQMHLRLPRRDCRGPSRTSPGRRSEGSVCEAVFFNWCFSCTVRNLLKQILNRIGETNLGIIEASGVRVGGVSVLRRGHLHICGGPAPFLQRLAGVWDFTGSWYVAHVVQFLTLEDYAKRWQQQSSCLYQRNTSITYLFGNPFSK